MENWLSTPPLNQNQGGCITENKGGVVVTGEGGGGGFDPLGVQPLTLKLQK